VPFTPLKFHYLKLAIAVAFLSFAFRASSSAATIANCNSAFTECLIPENVLLQLPFEAIAGDAVLTEPNSNSVSDVFRIFNNLADTGAGTGVGNLAFLFSSDDTALPPPSTYSANVVFLPESPSGVTPYLGNGTLYLLNAPEPGTLGVLCLAGAVLLLIRRKRARPFGGDR
jgi:hypothetical protein